MVSVCFHSAGEGHRGRQRYTELHTEMSHFNMSFLITPIEHNVQYQFKTLPEYRGLVVLYGIHHSHLTSRVFIIRHLL